MPEFTSAFLACPAKLEDPGSAADWLSALLGKWGRSNAAKFVAVAAKFKTPRGIATFNVASDHPIELAQFATHANWARSSQPAQRQYRDAQALFCLRRFAQAHPDVVQIVLIVDKPGEDDDLMSLLQTASPKPFHWLECDQPDETITHTRPVVFNRNSPDSDTALDMALDIALTGAIYGLYPYSLEALLEQATGAAAIATHLGRSGESELKS